MNGMKKNEILILAVLVLVACGVILFMKLGSGNKDKTTVEIRYYAAKGDYTVVKEFDPSADAVYHVDGNYGGLEVEVMATPGHSLGSVTLRCGDVLFCGDTLFAGSCGRTDFPGGSMQTILASLKRLGELQGEYQVCPGHMNTTELSRERICRMPAERSFRDRDTLMAPSSRKNLRISPAIFGTA
jgi:glyoxylase-like metal-dependent hydrolase (beta-lactamase superfamily II)